MFMCLAYFLSIVNNSNNKDLNYYIAKYIIENINHIGSITLQDVADGCFVSVPTVKQFLKKFGYSNYSNFKERLESELDVRKDQIYRGYKIFNKKRLAVAVSHLVDYPLEFNDKMKLKLIIKEIAQSQRVIIVASPTITPILFNFQIDMISMGKTVIMSSLLKDNSIEIEDNDLIILISGTGRLFLSDDNLVSILGNKANKVIIFSGETKINFHYNVFEVINILSNNEMFETEYLLLYYFDLIKFYYHEIIGLEVYEGDNLIGTIKEILQPGANDVWVVKRKGKRDLLLPYIPPVVLNVDIPNKRVDVEILEGLDDED